MDDPEVAADTIRELLLNSTDRLLRALQPGCRKKGRFSNIRVTLPNISWAVAPLLANIAIVCSGLNNAHHSKYATEEIDLPD